MVDLTLLEVEFPDAQFHAPFSSGTNSDDDPHESEDDSSGGKGRVLAVLLVAVGLSSLAWYLTRTDEEPEANTDADLEEAIA